MKEKTITDLLLLPDPGYWQLERALTGRLPGALPLEGEGLSLTSPDTSSCGCVPAMAYRPSCCVTQQGRVHGSAEPSTWVNKSKCMVQQRQVHKSEARA
jgi:hypothetical protein